MALSLGMSGQEVTDLQILLGAAGYPVPVSGLYDPETEFAVHNFQIAAGLPSDGVYGPETQAQLIGQVPETQALLSPAIQRQRVAAARFPGVAPVMVMDPIEITGHVPSTGTGTIIALLIAGGIYLLLRS